MNATTLYNRLEADFVTSSITEDWYKYGMSVIDNYITENFKQRSMGLLCDFATEVNHVYTAVFPSDKVLTKIIGDAAENAMLFVHHPQDWDLNREPGEAFYQINPALLKKLKERKISIFNFHYPLDNYGPYGTSKTLSDVLGITIEKPFAESGGALCGVIGATECKSVHELNAMLSQTVGHETKLYQYGNKAITDSRVAICAGGGNYTAAVMELIENGINVLVSGLSVKNSYSQEAHSLEEEYGINLIGATHYSSEKYACMAMCRYFNELGLPAEFVDDVPCLADL